MPFTTLEEAINRLLTSSGNDSNSAGTEANRSVLEGLGEEGVSNKKEYQANGSPYPPL